VWRVAVLLHPAQTLDGYLLGYLARRWVEEGIEVLELRDPAEHRDADLAIVHVDLTRVPAGFAPWSRRFPRALNAGVRDVSKRAISRHLVGPEDGTTGPVIVKSNLNYGGRPERALARAARGRGLLRRIARALRRRREPAVDPRAYPVYESALRVPARVWRDPELVVERFLPERDGGFYCARKHWVFGDRVLCWRARGTEPVVKAAVVVDRSVIPASPAVEAFRREIGLDFGKIDFTLPAGEPAILDVNPTPGCGRRGLPKGLPPLVEHLAPGIHDLLGAAGRRIG